MKCFIRDMSNTALGDVFGQINGVQGFVTMVILWLFSYQILRHNLYNLRVLSYCKVFVTRIQRFAFNCSHTSLYRVSLHYGKTDWNFQDMLTYFVTLYQNLIWILYEQQFNCAFLIFWTESQIFACSSYIN